MVSKQKFCPVLIVLEFEPEREVILLVGRCSLEEQDVVIRQFRGVVSVAVKPGLSALGIENHHAKQKEHQRNYFLHIFHFIFNQVKKNPDSNGCVLPGK